MTDGSRIIELQIDNFMALKAVEISPTGDVVTISGRNGQGKSSVLNAISAALGGVDGRKLPKPIRDGEERAEIILTTDKLKVTRIFSSTGPSLKVQSVDGATFTRGQAMLDELLGSLALDPLAFVDLKERDQLDQFLQVVALPEGFSLTRLDNERAEAFSKRTDVNREVKRLQSLGGPAYDPELPTEPQSLRDLMAEYNAASDRNVAIGRMRERATDAERDVREIEWKMEQLQIQLTAALEELGLAQEAVQSSPEPIDLATIDARVADVENENERRRANAGAATREKALKAAMEEAQLLTRQLEAVDQEKAEGLGRVVFPVEGLGFTSDGITYQGVPFKQASSSEQLRVSVAMAMATNPKLRVLRISGGERLDAAGRQLIADMAAEHDFQVWIEVVDETGQNGIVIEEGSVASVNA